jgi:hypothetical protein
MLPHAAGAGEPTRLFGIYNTVATLAGSLGALMALVGSSPHWLLAYPLAAALGLLATAGLSRSVERGHELEQEPLPLLHRSRGIVLRPLSQMDVPARQAYVIAVVDPVECTAAAAYTNTARYLTRPIAPLIAGATLRGALGAPFFIAGALKSVCDLGLYALFRNVEPLERGAERTPVNV